MTIRKFIEIAQMDFYNRLKEQKINKIYQKIGKYIYELYKSGNIIEDENLLKMLKEIDKIYKSDEK